METILKLYSKRKLSNKDCDIILSAIDNGEIETDTIKENFMDYMYNRLHFYIKKYTDEQVWSYTDEEYQNLLSHQDNFKLLIDFLKNKY